MKHQRQASIVAMALLLNACGHQQYVQAIDQRRIGAVEYDIKRQVGVYMNAVDKAPKPTIINDAGQPVVLPVGDPSKFACGAGYIDLDILSVKADLISTNEDIADGKLAIAAPIPVGSVGPSGEVNKDTVSTHELIYNVWFDPLKDQRDADEPFLKVPFDPTALNDAPIARTLYNLRTALIISGMRQDPYQTNPDPTKVNRLPCHWDWNEPQMKGGDPGNSVKYGITVVRDTKAGLDVKVEIVDIGVSAEHKSTTGNTLTVSFYQTDRLEDKPKIKIPPETSLLRYCKTHKADPKCIGAIF